MEAIFISSGAISKKQIGEIVKELGREGIKNIELTGGTEYYPNCLQELIFLKNSLNLNLICHNYFPPPREHFVFNLASLNKKVWERSYSHAIEGIKWSKELGAKNYSFHAGFLFDPQTNELGKRIKRKKLFDRKKSIDIFLETIDSLSRFSKKLGINLLIENNVLSNRNYLEFECNPFLMVDADESIFIMENTPDNVNLLIDVAHLKVSAHSLDFDPKEYLIQCSPWTNGYHLSDNNGKEDSNNKVSEESWFWPSLKRELDYYSIEVYGLTIKEIREQINFVEAKLLSE